MKKYLLATSLFLAFAMQALCQYTAERRKDSLKIDSMKKVLPLLRDSTRVDCMNQICKKYRFIMGVGGFVHRADSIFHFALLANDEANRIGYKYGIAASLLNLARSKRYNFERTTSEETVIEKYLRQALSVATEIKNDHLLGETYYLLAGLEHGAENYKKAIYYFQKTGDVQQETEVTTWLCMEYSNKGEYEKALPYCDKCIELAKKNVQTDTSEWGHELVKWSLFDMADIYKAAGDYENAMAYLLRGNNYAVDNNLSWTMYMEISELYCLMGKYDSALYYWNFWKKDWNKYGWGHQALGNTILGQIYLGTNQHDKIIPLLRDHIIAFRKGGKEFGNGIIRPLLLTGEAYTQKKNYTVALKYVNEAFKYAKENNARPYMMDSYKLLSNLYHHLGKNDKAYLYLLEYTTLKDSILNKQFLLRLNNYKKALCL